MYGTKTRSQIKHAGEWCDKVTISSLAKSSLFQLNLLLWATMPCAPTSPIRSALLDWGYTALSIEQRLPANANARSRIDQAKADIGPNPTPDVVLVNTNLERFVLVELKPDSFGPDTTQAKQLRGLLVAAGDITRRGMNIASGTAEVCYVLPHEKVPLLTTTASNCKTSLEMEAFPTSPISVVGIRVDTDAVFLTRQTDVDSDTIAANIDSVVKVLDLTPGEDPRPLYIIPWIPNADSQDLSALREKLRAILTAEVGKAKLGSSTVPYNSILAQISPVYLRWEDRTSMVGELHSEVRNTIDAIFGADTRVVRRTSDVSLLVDSNADRADLLESCRTANLRRGLSPGAQLSLLDGD